LVTHATLSDDGGALYAIVDARTLVHVHAPLAAAAAASSTARQLAPLDLVASGLFSSPAARVVALAYVADLGGGGGGGGGANDLRRDDECDFGAPTPTPSHATTGAALCIMSSDGDIVTLDLDASLVDARRHVAECVGLVDGGIAGAWWSPDGELVRIL